MSRSRPAFSLRGCAIFAATQKSRLACPGRDLRFRSGGVSFLHPTQEQQIRILVRPFALGELSFSREAQEKLLNAPRLAGVACL